MRRLLPVGLGALAVLVVLLVTPFAMYVAALTLVPAAVQAQAAGPTAVSVVTSGGSSAGAFALGPVIEKLPKPPHRVWASMWIPLGPLFAKTPQGGFDVGGLPYGQCTWYVAYERGLVAHANGEGWVRTLAAQGHPVNNRPSLGAILSWRAYAPGYGVYGHVALVVDVDPDGRGFTVAEANVLGEGIADVRWVPINDPGIVGFIP